VIDAGGNSLGEFGQDGKPVGPKVSFAPSEERRERDFARELAERVAKDAADPQPKPEAETVRGIEQRAALHESAYLAAKQPALDALPKEADGTARLADRLAELRKRDVETVSPEVARQWAEVDARDFAKLQEPTKREDAAVAMAENARNSAAYSAALTVRAPEVAAEVEAIDKANSERSAAKDDRKNAEFDAMQAAKVAEAQSWSPEVAKQRAEADAAALKAETDATERHYKTGDMALAAQNNEAYKASLAAQGVSVDAAEKPAEAARKDAANEARMVEPMTIDPAQLERVAQARAADSKQAAQELGLNGIEPAIEREQQKLEGDAEAKRSAWLKKGKDAQADQPKAQAAAASGNKVESDEVFTATDAAVKPVVPPEVEQKYLRVGDKFYHPKNTDVVAFEDKGNKLETRSNSEQVAETMVTIARARGWDEIKVSGSETFRKEVWLEAAAYGMQVKGYTPTEQDKAELAKRSRDVDANKVGPDKAFRARETEAAPAAPKEGVSMRQAGENIRAATEAQAQADAQTMERQARAQAFAQKPAAEALKAHPELAGSYAAVSSMEKQTDADNLTPQQKAVVMARVKQNIVNSIERGDIPEVKVREETEVKRERKEEREVSR
jgi:hypothetical protein